MRRPGFRRLFLLLVLLPALSQAALPPVVATAPSREAVEAVMPLYLADPEGYRQALQPLLDAPPPADATTAGLLRLAQARSEALVGRYDEALDLARPLADEADEPGLRLRAAALMVDVHAAARRFTTGQQRLEPLLIDARAQPEAALKRIAWLSAAVFHAELGQDEAVLEDTRALLAAGPTPLERCVAQRLSLDARQGLADPTLGEADFETAFTACESIGAALPLARLVVSRARWQLAAGQHREAAAQLAKAWPGIEALALPRLLAEAHVLRAEARRRMGELDGAEADVTQALAHSMALPTGLPLLRARRTAYAIALDRGDDTRSLAALQAVLVAERAYGEELQRLQRDSFAGRAESAALLQAAALMEQRNTQLELEAEAARRLTQATTFALVPVGLGLIGVIALGLRTRTHRRRLEERLRIDAMTGLWTRAHFSQNATEQLGRLAREASPGMLMLVDLDHFSQINARHGHLAGDRLLTAIGACLRDTAGPQGGFARMGGEEFALFLPQAGIDQGLALAERCREAIAAIVAGDGENGEPVRTTASFGVTSTAIAGYRLRDLLASADAALYRAKHAGRNRVAAAAMAPSAEAGT